ncbi:MAG: SLBB domain-containing protein [Candidatus Cloacimonetes bacterium]|nr:SLBB domain-containing protein [Candidatus Cloacimonadota bacterium]
MMRNLLLLLTLIVAICLQGQTSEMTTFNPGSVYQYPGAGNEQFMINTYIWGQVRNPGLYKIPDNTDLLTLLSSAGGPTENAKLSKVKIIRPVAGGERIIYVDLKEYMRTGDMSLIPIMKPGDTVFVAGTAFYAIERVSSFLGSVVIFFSVYTMINSSK